MCLCGGEHGPRIGRDPPWIGWTALGRTDPFTVYVATADFGRLVSNDHLIRLVVYNLHYFATLIDTWNLGQTRITYVSVLLSIRMSTQLAQRDSASKNTEKKDDYLLIGIDHTKHSGLRGGLLVHVNNNCKKRGCTTRGVA